MHRTLVVLVAISIFGIKSATGDQEQRVLHDKDINAEFFRRPPPSEPPPHLANKPTGSFTPMELFELCSFIGLQITMANYDRESNMMPDRESLEFVIEYGEVFLALRKKNIALAERVTQYARDRFTAVTIRSPDEARALMTRFPSERKFIGFNTANVKSCYTDLGAW